MFQDLRLKIVMKVNVQREQSHDTLLMCQRNKYDSPTRMSTFEPSRTGKALQHPFVFEQMIERTNGKNTNKYFEF